MGFGSNFMRFAGNIFKSEEEENAAETTLVTEEEMDAAQPTHLSGDGSVMLLQECAVALHGSTDSKVISSHLMNMLREYYESDFVCVLEINLDLDYWFMRWGSREGCDDIEKANIKQLLLPEEYTHYAKSWIRAFYRNEPILVEDVEAVKDVDPAEYALYTRLEATSVMGFPFYKISQGFVVVRNPKKHFGDIALLQLCTYALMMELNQFKTTKSIRLQAENFNISDENEVRLGLFDGVKITHIGGQYIHENFTPDQRIVLAYMAFYPKTKSAREMEIEIWKEYEDYLQEGQKVRRAVNAIVNKCTLLKLPLIYRDDAGYKFNPNLKVVVDVQEFMKMSELVTQVADPITRRHILEDMVAMYKGPIRAEAKAPSWLTQAQHHMESLYLMAIKRLLYILYHEGDYEALHSYAAKSMAIVANNTEGYYWKIRAYRTTLNLDKANSLQETAQKCIPGEEYQYLVKRLDSRDDMDPDYVF